MPHCLHLSTASEQQDADNLTAGRTTRMWSKHRLSLHRVHTACCGIHLHIVLVPSMTCIYTMLVYTYLDSVVQGHLTKAHAIPTGCQEVASSIQSLHSTWMSCYCMLHLVPCITVKSAWISSAVCACSVCSNLHWLGLILNLAIGVHPGASQPHGLCQVLVWGKLLHSSACEVCNTIGRMAPQGRSWSQEVRQARA